MALADVPLQWTNHAEQMAAMALEMGQVIQCYNRDTGKSVQIRIGLHSGPLVAGVIGKQKLAYDLWGDTVNHEAG